MISRSCEPSLEELVSGTSVENSQFAQRISLGVNGNTSELFGCLVHDNDGCDAPQVRVRRKWFQAPVIV